MDFNKLTLKSQEAVASAQELARRAGNPELTPDHLTVALLDQDYAKDNKLSVAQVAKNAGITITDFARFKVGA